MTTNSKVRLTAPLAVVIAALFGALGGIANQYIAQRSAGAEPKPPPSDPTVKPLAAATSPGFGQWTSNLQQNIAYKAESDGFVSAVSGGGKPAAGIAFYSGETANAMTMRIRSASSYDGGLLPVRKGEYWLVSPWNGAGQITIQWLPVGS